MTLRDLERNLLSTLGLAVLAGHEDPDHCGQLGGYAVAFLGEMRRAGGLASLVRECTEAEAAEEAAMARRRGGRP